MGNYFSENIEFLGSFVPYLAKQYRAYKPQKIHVDDQYEDDLIVNGRPFYGGNARSACVSQVEVFKKHPTHHSVSYRSQPQAKNVHQKVINSLNDAASDLDHRSKGKPYEASLFILGVGLGFHIDALIQGENYPHIILVEPDFDIFYHFLHSVRLVELHEYCEARGGQLIILQPESLRDFSVKVSSLSKKVGIKILSEISVFRHYETDLIDEIYCGFRSLRHDWLSAWGFFDDEIIGLKHSLENLSESRFAVNECKRLDSEAVFLVIGNGPSLDSDLDEIRFKREQFVVVSCGTSVGALLRAGIEPDIHVEMERSLFTASVQSPWFDDEFCARTLLIALNTVPSSVIKKFPNSILFAKNGDVGSTFLNKCLGNDWHYLPNCNPTVTNLAVSALARLGVRKIALLGCDYGFRKLNHHHSTKSDYFSDKSVLKGARYESEVVVRDNHGNGIHSTRIFNQARKKIESVISECTATTFINCSDGAKINGAEFQIFSDVRSTEFSFGKIRNHFFANLTSYDNDIQSGLFQGLEYLIGVAERQKQIFSINHGTLKTSSILNDLFTHAILELEKQNNQFGEYVLYSGINKYLSAASSGHLCRMPEHNRSSYVQVVLDEVSLMWDEIGKELRAIKEQFNEV
ncbi:6-hydroxymethylpterin diphosphokinase MptE-like protein [Marinomonas balearica]|uniref:Uncharacterized protein DUF115 n=1 Tax=Marinomonas balearica TaxID=491947 RepID=A0A4R6MDG9_9GAMM|nr:6-hydroxymethylpterin diphosphokinase MptE-like protein [Marinomonas balearica]TDO99436.1 uncharacterized protein DUF115 [Marinomonas balearica]